MSEQLSDNHDIENNSAETVEQAPEQDAEKLIEAHSEEPEQDTPKVEEIREVVSETAETVTAPDLEINKVEEPVELPPPNKALKTQSLNRTLKETREKLSKPQRAFSKVIHQTQVDAISNATGKTIARPSGLFFGGFFALIGSALYLFFSYRYHFAYKYIAFSLFFVGGFIIGLVIEFLGKLFKRRRA